MKAHRANNIVHRQTFGYTRVSSEGQADRGISLDAQRAKIGAYYVAMGWALSEVVCDPGHSAKTLQRPGMGKILDAIRAGAVERVIVTKLDRLTRSVRDLSDLLDLFAQHDVALVSIGETLDTSSASGRMVVGMLGVIGQWEREAIGERTATALGHKRAQRQVYGRTPFGYHRQGDVLVPNPVEQVTLAKAVAMDRAGASFREIGRMLTAAGARAKVWQASSVRAMLRSKMAMEAA